MNAHQSHSHNDEHGQQTLTVCQPPTRVHVSPLGWSIAGRLLWAAGASALLWLAVAWAIGWQT